MKTVKIVKTVLIVLTLFLIGTFLAPSSRADEYDKRTTVTISTPFEIPGGQVLPAGTYVFSLYDSPADRHVVQIWSADGAKLIANVLTIDNYRMTATGKTVMLFSERPGDQPNAIKVWFYPGNTWGQEFVYPKERAKQLAVANKEPVPALAVDKLPVMAELKTTPIIAITPEEKEVSVTDVILVAPPAKTSQATELEAENNAPASVQQSHLPKTASSIPLMALLGAASIGLALLLKQIAG